MKTKRLNKEKREQATAAVLETIDNEKLTQVACAIFTETVGEFDEENSDHCTLLEDISADLSKALENTVASTIANY
jgi:hypothetical protein